MFAELKQSMINTGWNGVDEAEKRCTWKTIDPPATCTLVTNRTRGCIVSCHKAVLEGERYRSAAGDRVSFLQKFMQ